jgi:16S rRNA (cytosine1402-N4)-methyltransferase
MMEYHRPVMVRESLEGLNLQPGGIYVDLTFGGGGHSSEILARLESGRLFAFDQDEDARSNANQIQNSSFTFIQANFRFLNRYLKFHKVNAVDGILADLGVSSYQFDQAERGFSIRNNARLDMRMDKKNPLDAVKVLNEYEESRLQEVFRLYGELPNSRALAKSISEHRAMKLIETVADLKEVLQRFVPKHSEFKYLARVFQAIRIEVNDELKALEEMLEQATTLLKPGGRLVVISYHSLEDRLVKNYFATGNFQGEPDKDFYGNLVRPLQPVTRKPAVPSKVEIAENNRARSAKLRIAQKI